MNSSFAKLISLLCVVLLMLTCHAKVRRKKNHDNDLIFSGSTPAGATKWKSDSSGSIFTFVDLRHLKFDRTPKFLVTVTSKSPSRPLVGTNSTAESVYTSSPLAKRVVGKHRISQVDTNGFRVRLRYNDSEDGDVLNEYLARRNDLRVRWIAILEGHSLLDKARVDVENEKYENGIDEIPVGQALAYVKMLDAFASEDPSVVQGALGRDYQLPNSRRLKIKTPKQPRTKNEPESSTAGNANVSDDVVPVENDTADESQSTLGSEKNGEPGVSSDSSKESKSAAETDE